MAPGAVKNSNVALDWKTLETPGLPYYKMFEVLFLWLKISGQIWIFTRLPCFDFPNLKVLIYFQHLFVRMSLNLFKVCYWIIGFKIPVPNQPVIMTRIIKHQKKEYWICLPFERICLWGNYWKSDQVYHYITADFSSEDFRANGAIRDFDNLKFWNEKKFHYQDLLSFLITFCSSSSERIFPCAGRQL